MAGPGRLEDLEISRCFQLPATQTQAHTHALVSCRQASIPILIGLDVIRRVMALRSTASSMGSGHSRSSLRLGRRRMLHG